MSTPRPEQALVNAAASEIPKILTLMDRNPHSPTYGCFDRLHWHYRVTDFPSGMSQEFVWPLALCYDMQLPTSSSADGRLVQALHRNDVVKEWVRAGIAFAASSAHGDGSCDDYFPFERASGAAAFSLLACTEACRLLSLQEAELFGFLEKRADLLSDRQESGRLTNHHALIALALCRLTALVGTDRWRGSIDRRIDQVLSWQHDEGWFPEYEGFDPGYHTLTIWCLAELERSIERPELRSSLVTAIELAADFVHPDGSYGGEYGSRNTYNFFPAGFEIAGRWLPKALAVNDRFLAGLASGMAPCYSDDRIVGHHVWNYLLAFKEFVGNRSAVLERPSERHHYPGAGLIVDRRHDRELYLAVTKGGVFKLYRDGKHSLSDTGWSIVFKNPKHKNAVAGLAGDYQLEVGPDQYEISGQLGHAKHKQMTPFSNVALRLIMLTIGRLFPDLVRTLLQRALITGQTRVPFRFVRRIRWADNRCVVEDEIQGPWSRVRALGLGRNQASNYNVMSRVFQENQLDSWTDLSKRLRNLKDGETVTVKRTL